MSTEHHESPDLEYGPTPPGAKYEHTDIDVSVGYKFGLWLAVSMLISIGIVTGVFYFFEGRGKSANALAQKYPLAAGQVKQPPAPNLQNQPFKDIYLLRQAEREKLTTYGWVDRGSGVVHMPIEDAMRLLHERKMLNARPQPSPHQVTMDSSAGRTTSGR